MEEVHRKNKLTQWGSQILMSILMSHMMVTKNPQNVHRKYFWAILVTFIFDIKIDVNVCEPHDVNLFFLWTSSIVCIFDFFIFDIFLTTWHLFDNLTSYWHLTYNMGTWWTCAGSCVQWILPIPIRSRWGIGVMGHMGNGHKKDVKLSKRCQMSKNQTPGLWKRFTRKINWHNEVHRYWHQFWHHIWWSLKTLKMFTESIFGQFWWPSYLTSKLTSISVNLMMSNLFFLWTSSIVCIFDFFIFDIFLTTWHLFDNLTSFWQLDIFLTTWHVIDTWLITWAHGEHVQDHVFNEYCQYLLDLDGAQGWWGTWAMGPMGNWHIN